jgi:hypothetical protein
MVGLIWRGGDHKTMGVREKTASGRGLDGYGIFLKYVKSADIS